MGPLGSCDNCLPGCGCRKRERTGYILEVTPFWRTSCVQNIADKDVETEETSRNEEDDQRGEQQERPGRRYDSDDSGDGDRDERDGDGESDVRARWLHRSCPRGRCSRATVYLSGERHGRSGPGQSRSNSELPMATTNRPRPLSTLENFLIGGVAACCAVSTECSWCRRRKEKNNSNPRLGHRFEPSRGGKDPFAIARRTCPGWWPEGLQQRFGCIWEDMEERGHTWNPARTSSGGASRVLPDSIHANGMRS